MSRADSRYPRLGSMSLKEFRAHLGNFDAEVPCDEEILAAPDSPLAAPLEHRGRTIGNRWAIQPMEGWDGELDGNPGELTFRRWRHFGASGAKLIWGGEAVAVELGGRANPNQLLIAPATMAGLEKLREALIGAHRERFGRTDDLLVGLQLTHSGRFAQPQGKTPAGPRVAYRHPILDRRTGITSDDQVLSDGELQRIGESFVTAAARAREIGFDFVDIKHCHGYLLHEVLGGHTREGRYGGSLENRARLLDEIAAGIRRDAPGLEIAVRLSAFDTAPFRPDPARASGDRLGPGIPDVDAKNGDPENETYPWGFGIDRDDPTQFDLDEAKRLLAHLADLDIRLVNISAGSPYYNPHVQRPALYPPSDGYQPPEDPLAGVVRHLRVTRELKRAAPDLVLVGSALSYLQDWLPHVAQGLIRDDWMDFAGLGRIVLSYWDLPADSLERGELTRKRICRTFSDCTTAPRAGLRSGCYPLDKFYAALPEGERLREIKRGRS